MLHAMPGAAASAAGHIQCLKQLLPQVPKAQSSRQPAQPCSNSSSTHVRLQPVRAAAAGNSDSCSTCGRNGSGLEQQQSVWRSMQPPMEQAVESACTSSTSSTAQQSSTTSSWQGSNPGRQQSSIQQAPIQGPSASSNGRSSKVPGQHSRDSCQRPQPSNRQLSGAAIMRQLKAASSWQELQVLMQQHGAELNWQHSSAMITHVAQLSTRQQWHKQQAQQVSIPGQQQLYSEQEHYSEAQQPQVQQQQQLDRSCMPLSPPPLQQRQQVLQSGGTSNGTSSSRQGSVGSRSPELGLQQLPQFLQADVLPLVDSHLQSYDARGLANCLWAVAKLQLQSIMQPSSSWLQQYCSVSQPLLQQFDAQQLSNTLWGLVQLQHVPTQGWLHSWYAAMLQACQPDDPTWQPQSVSSALWALAQLHGNTSSSSSSSSGASCRGSSSNKAGSGPTGQWLHQLLLLAMQRVAAESPGAEAAKGSSGSSSGQVVSNLLWACVLLQQLPGPQVLRLLHSWLEQLLAADASQEHSQQQVQQQGLSDQSIANCMWALGKLYQRFEQELPQQEAQALRRQGQALRRGTRAASRQFKGLACGCGKLLLQLSAPRLASTSSHHLSNIMWGAGALRLELEQPQQVAAVAVVVQQLPLRARSLTDQQVSNVLWGLSRVKQQPVEPLPQQQHHEQEQVSSMQHGPSQQQWQRQVALTTQQQQHADCIEQLLTAQVDRLQGFSSQAIGSTLLSLARMQHISSDQVLHAWLHAVSSRSLASKTDLAAAVDACVALSLLRQQQAVAATSGRSVGSGRAWSSSGSTASSADSQWLQALCTATNSRLGACTAEQLCALAKSMGVLQFRAPVSWLAAWQAAVVSKADGMSGAMAARMLSTMQDLPGVAALGAATLQSTRAMLADAAVASATATAAAGKASAEDLAAAAACVAAVRGRGSEQSLQQLLQAVPPVLSSCSTRQLAQLMSAAAAMQAPLQPGLLPAVVQEAQRKQHAQQSGTRTLRLLVAVAKLTHQQQQRLLTSPGLPTAQRDQQQQHLTEQASVQDQQHFQLQQEQDAVLQWLEQSIPQLQLAGASGAYLSATLWAVALLCFHPGRSWLDAWVQHSMPVLQAMEPQQLASCGWALTVLRYRPAPRWLALWSRAVAQHVSSAAVQPRSLALLLYSSATLSCPVNASWLRSVGVLLAARQVGSWAAADLADGLWGLGQLGLRAVAEDEVLELLLGRLVEATAAQGQLQRLGPHRQLQILQAAVLLGPGPEPAQTQLQKLQQRVKRTRHPQRRLKLEQRLKTRRKRLLRWFSWRAWIGAAVARAAAAAAAGAAQQQQGFSTSGSFSDSSSSSSEDSRKAVAALVGKAAVVAAKYVQIKTGRDPAAAAAAGVLTPDWFEYWCRCSVRQLQHWRPQQVAAALAAFAALSWQPPLPWQQQMLGHVVQQGRLSVQTASAIQDALVALQSPLARSWRGTATVQYMPARSSAPTAPAERAAAATPAAGVLQQAQQQQQLRLQLQTDSSAGSAFEPSYPHHLRGNSMRRLQRKQHMMRLVGWWRQQQVMQQQYAQQRQQQQQEEELWRAAAAAAGVGGYSSSVSSSSVSPVGSGSFSSLSSISGTSSPYSSVDSASGTASGTAGGLVVPSSGTPAGPAPRRLDSSSWGRQLTRPAARPASGLASAGAGIAYAADPAGGMLPGSSDAGSSSSSSSDSGCSRSEASLQLAMDSDVDADTSAAGNSDAAGNAATVMGQAAQNSAQPTCAANSNGTGPTSSSSSSSASSAAAGASLGSGGQAPPVPGVSNVVQVIRADTPAVPAWDSWAAVGAVGQAAASGSPVFVYGPGRQVNQPGTVWQQ